MAKFIKNLGENISVEGGRGREERVWVSMISLRSRGHDRDKHKHVSPQKTDGTLTTDNMKQVGPRLDLRRAYARIHTRNTYIHTQNLCYRQPGTSLTCRCQPCRNAMASIFPVVRSKAWEALQNKSKARRCYDMHTTARATLPPFDPHSTPLPNLLYPKTVSRCNTLISPRLYETSRGGYEFSYLPTRTNSAVASKYFHTYSLL